MVIPKIAFRNLWRNKRRTQLTMGAMIFACSLLIISLGYYDGMLWNMINNATEKDSGHITLSAKGYIDNPSLNITINGNSMKAIPPEIEAKIKGTCPRINVFGLLSSGKGRNSKTQPAQIIGINPDAEKSVSRFSQSIIEGHFLDKRLDEIVLGKGLSKKIGAGIGSEIVLMSTGADGSMVAELFTLTGIIDTDDNLRDSALALANIKKIQEAFALPGKLHSLKFFLKNPMQAKEIAIKLQNQNSEYEVTPWHQIFPQISSLLNIWFGMQVFTMAIYYAAVLLITFNTMYMAFLERIREFAIIGAIGLTKTRLAALIICESCFISIFSAIAGSVIGFLAILCFYYHPINLSAYMGSIAWGGSTISPQFFCVPSSLNILMPMLSMIFLGIFVAAFPAWKLFRLRPVEALREV